MFRKKLQAALLCLAASFMSFSAQAVEGVQTPGVEITWLGGATMVMEFNGFRIVTDPVLGEGKHAFTMGDPNEMFDLAKGPNIRNFERFTALPEVDTASLDLLLLSHAHEDHFDQAAQKKLPKNMTTILPPADGEKLKQIGFNRIAPLDWGNSKTFDAHPGTITITVVQAHHSPHSKMDKILGRGNGYWIEFAQGDWQRTIYWTGDTFATKGVVKNIQSIGKPDILIPHLGAVGTTGPLGQISMGAADVVAFAKKISPRKILPIHHSTFPLYLEPVSKLVRQGNENGLSLDLPSVGTIVRY